METVALLDMVLYRFRDLFGSQNFSLFCAYLYGVILCEGRHSVTQIYLASGCEVSYWSLLKSFAWQMGQAQGVWSLNSDHLGLCP